MYNELDITYTTPEKVYDVKRGKVSIRLGIEGHGMYGLSVNYDWGVSTSNFFHLDRISDWDVPLEEQVRIPLDYVADLPKALLKVFGIDYGYLDDITDREVYILFSDRNVPAGFVNIRDTQNYFVYDDFFAQYSDPATN